MGYLTAKQFSEKWGITERRIIKLCGEKRINGAIKNGMVWLIPEETLKPSDKRNKVSKYINTQKRIMIVNFNNELGYFLIPLLQKNGYVVDGINTKKILNTVEVKNFRFWNTKFKNKNEIEELLNVVSKYYDGLVFIEMEEKTSHKEYFIKEFAKKMDCDSSIVLINSFKNRNEKIEKKLSKELKENIGTRINSIDINVEINDNILMDYMQIAEDAVELLIKFKNTTGISIMTDGDFLEFNENGRTSPLETGKFYRTINNYFKELNKKSYMWCASTMLEDEWTEEPLEMNFRVQNLEAANRGANIERIFIFSRSKIKEFKNNKTLRIYMQSNINTMFVDYDEILAKEPELLDIVGEGWDGIDKDSLIADLPLSEKGRGYISKNKEEVLKAYEVFQRLKKYAHDLKKILK